MRETALGAAQKELQGLLAALPYAQPPFSTDVGEWWLCAALLV